MEMLSEFVREHRNWFSLPLTVLAVFAVFLFLRAVILKALAGRMSPPVRQAVRKGFFYAAVVVSAVTILGRLGVNLSALLGAAGIVGVAVGFASQTSVSNVISGFFLLAGRSLKPGDKVRVNSVEGTVESMDFLSVHLKSASGDFIRVSNESILKSNFINLSRFPERRVSVRVSLSAAALAAWASAPAESPENPESPEAEKPAPGGILPAFWFAKTRDTVLYAARSCGGVLPSPAPEFSVREFHGGGAGTVEAVLSVWCKNTDAEQVRESLLLALPGVFAGSGDPLQNPLLLAAAAPEG